MAEQKISLKELNTLELERKHISTAGKVLQRILTALPIVAGLLHLIEYMFIPNKGMNTCTATYAYILIFFIGVWAVLYIISFFNFALYKKINHIILIVMKLLKRLKTQMVIQNSKVGMKL